MPKMKKELLKEVLEEKGLSEDEIKERLNEEYTDEELAYKQRPTFGFKVIKVSSGKFRVIDKRGLFITPELSENEAYNIAKQMNLRNPENKLKVIKEEGFWNDL